MEVGSVREVADAVMPLVDLQPERNRLYRLARAPGPNPPVDAITVGLVAAAGLDPAGVMREFTSTWRFTIDVVRDGEWRMIHLTSEGTWIRSQLSLRDEPHQYWTGRCLGIENPTRKAKAAKPGGLCSVVAMNLSAFAQGRDHCRKRRLYRVHVRQVEAEALAQLDRSFRAVQGR